MTECSRLVDDVDVFAIALLLMLSSEVDVRVIRVHIIISFYLF